MSRPFPNLPAVHIPVRNEPVRRLAAPGVGRRAAHHRHHPYHQHRRQDAPEAHEIMSRNMESPEASSTSNEPSVPAHAEASPRPTAGVPAKNRPRPPGAPSWRSGALAFSTAGTGRCTTSTWTLRPPDHGIHRPIRLWQIHAAASLEPHLRALSRAKRATGKIMLGGRNLSRACGRRSTCCAPRWGWGFRSRHHSRCRCKTTSASASIFTNVSRAPTWRRACNGRWRKLPSGTRSRTSYAKMERLCRADSSSGCALRVPWPSSRTSCYSTNRPPRWIPSRRRKLSNSSPSSRRTTPSQS